MVKQKFVRGDKVRVAKDLGPMMDLFTGKGQEAYILYSYHDCYGGSPDSKKQYAIMILPEGFRTSWYYDHQLTLVKKANMKAHNEIQKYLERE